MSQNRIGGCERRNKGDWGKVEGSVGKFVGGWGDAIAIGSHAIPTAS